VFFCGCDVAMLLTLAFIPFVLKQAAVRSDGTAELRS
jgi:hypothetical protein